MTHCRHLRGNRVSRLVPVFGATLSSMFCVVWAVEQQASAYKDTRTVWGGAPVSENRNTGRSEKVTAIIQIEMVNVLTEKVEDLPSEPLSKRIHSFQWYFSSAEYVKRQTCNSWFCGNNQTCCWGKKTTQTVYVAFICVIYIYPALSWLITSTFSCFHFVCWVVYFLTGKHHRNQKSI